MTSSTSKSFDTWPHTTSLLSAITQAGFYYTYEEDTVVYHECDIHLSGWVPEDDPLHEHLSQSPSYPLTQKLSKDKQEALSTPPSYRSVSPAPPVYSKPYITIDDLYIRYAPLKSTKTRPTVLLPVMTITDLYTKFHKPKDSPPTPPQDQPEPPTTSFKIELTEEQKQRISEQASELCDIIKKYSMLSSQPPTSKPPTSKSNGKSKGRARNRNGHTKTG